MAVSLRTAHAEPGRSALPEPDADARAHSERVRAFVVGAIDRAGGWIPLAEYIRIALYAPGLGYYAAGARKLGPAGDFTTAPEMTPLYGAALAAQVAPILAAGSGREIVEPGAGSGRLAVDLVRALDGLGELRVGTALGEGVTTSLSALQAAGAIADPPPANPSDSPGRILLLTDGANSIPNATSPEAAAQRAASEGVPIYSILLGDDPGRPDQPLPSETLSAMSSSTGGIFAQTTTTADLQAVFADIGSVVAPVDELRELSVWFAGLALVLLVGAGACAALSRPRPPRGRAVASLGPSA